MASLSLPGSGLSGPFHPPAVILNIGICASVAGLVDQLGRRGGGHSKAPCSMSIRPQLTFKAPGCQSPSLIRPQWHQRKTSASHANVLRFGFLSAVVWFCVHKHGNYDDSECSLRHGGPTKSNHSTAVKTTTNGGHSGDLRDGGL